MSASVWHRLQAHLQRSLPPEEFRTWFGPLAVESESESRLILRAPNQRFVSSLEEVYRPMVDRAVADLQGASYEVLFSFGDAARASAPVADAPFESRYQFDTFVVGNSNQLAYAAARAVADKPGRSYNPLFLYGGVGLGKTHLLHAIGHQIRRKHNRLQVKYLPTEQFVNELINAIRFDRTASFREKYRSVDVLLADDVQFLANKERMQEEFFHTFNTLYSASKQIILTCDTSPKHIQTLQERLRSRFEWGLIADIGSPDVETKIAILRGKAEAEGIQLHDDVANFIARQVRSNVRELEGLLNRVLAFSSLTGRPLDIELTKDTLKDILPDSDGRTKAPEIIKHVARFYGLKLSEIKSKTNSRQIAFPRQVAMYLCKKLTDLSFPEIGRHFNDKHHST
ncbi:MAG TPA: chromosomal replication initiator protein DnaA, partial [Thermoanaerobaculia bacterium]|nr:chromosomal replication initiator protein DnaA [Thermoanaerobaculia bacterium]